MRMLSLLHPEHHDWPATGDARDAQADGEHRRVMIAFSTACH